MAANVKNLPLSVIFAAKSGDGQALGAVLNHYQRYIRSLATRTLTDECGSESNHAMEYSISYLPTEFFGVPSTKRP